MEQALTKALEKQIEDAEEERETEAADMIRDHLEKTKMHSDRVQECIERLGGKISTAKKVAAKVAAALGGAPGSMTKDTLVKNTLSAYAAEHMEIASYTSLIAAAEELGDIETERVCRSILEDEVEMAEWLGLQIPEVTLKQLAKGK